MVQERVADADLSASVTRSTAGIMTWHLVRSITPNRRSRPMEPEKPERRAAKSKLSPSVVQTVNDKGASVQFDTKTWPIASIHACIRQLCDIYNQRADLTGDDEGVKADLALVSTPSLTEEVMARFDHAVLVGRKSMRPGVSGYYKRWSGDREVCAGIASHMQSELYNDYCASDAESGEM